MARLLWLATISCRYLRARRSTSSGGSSSRSASSSTPDRYRALSVISSYTSCGILYCCPITERSARSSASVARSRTNSGSDPPPSSVSRSRNSPTVAGSPATTSQRPGSARRIRRCSRSQGRRGLSMGAASASRLLRVGGPSAGSQVTRTGASSGSSPRRNRAAMCGTVNGTISLPSPRSRTQAAMTSRSTGPVASTRYTVTRILPMRRARRSGRRARPPRRRRAPRPGPPACNAGTGPARSPPPGPC